MEACESENKVLTFVNKAITIFFVELGNRFPNYEIQTMSIRRNEQ